MKVNFAHIQPRGNVEVTMTPVELTLAAYAMAYAAKYDSADKDTKSKLESMVKTLKKHM